MLTTDRSNLRGQAELLDALHEAGSRLPVPGRVTLDLSGVDFLYIGGLVLLATWCRRHQVYPAVINASARTTDYLDQIGLGDWHSGAFSMSRLRDPAGWSVAIVSLDTDLPETLAEKLTGICVERGWVGSRDRNALVILFAEIIENVARHAGHGAAAMIGAQYYPTKKKLHICLADTGMGIRASFLQGRNQTAIDRIVAGESPLYLAASPRVTSKPVVSPYEQGHAGYGLYLAAELARRNYGTFALSSDGDTLMRFQREKYGVRKDVLNHHSPWQGTVINLILNLDQLLPLSEIYAAMPAPAGFEDEDFFTAP